MNDNTIPNGPLPEKVTLLDDNGIPDAIINIDTIQMAATRLMYDMAANSGDAEALKKISAQYLDEVGVNLFGYVTGAALKMMTSYILEPILETCDLAEIMLRPGLTESANYANDTLR